MGKTCLGTDGTKRDVMARVIHGFRLSVLFTLLVTGASAVIGVIAGAVQGYFGGRTDLIFQRIIEVWSSTPSLYVIIIMFAILGRSFWLLVFLLVCLAGPALLGWCVPNFCARATLNTCARPVPLGSGT